ncbi:MAG TPA: twin-arginine translocation signal domain-containing protein, partial [Geobacteraceae bacterium]|nr:twin-arginine translocation signal domain-containing protein [Geobacteraceae bacterium]
MGKKGDENGNTVVEQDFNISRILAERGVSRRDFMKFCTAMSAALALPVTFA